MFNKLLILSTFIFLMIGCNFTDRTEDLKVPDEPPPTDEEAIYLSKGDKVVALWSGNSFYEGEIIKMNGRNMTIKWADGSNPTVVEGSHIYPYPETETRGLVGGDIVLANGGVSTQWKGAKIKEVASGVYGVKYLDGSGSTTLSSDKVIKISMMTATLFKEEEPEDSDDFLRKAQSKNPTSPKAYKAKKGDKVLALWSINSWWSGRVNKVKVDKITVAWDDGSTPSDVDADKVLPFPNASNAEKTTAGEYVLAKPESGTQWVYARIVSIDDNEIVISNQDDSQRKLKFGEVVPLN